ncbi:hypothetical protein AJ88_32265 [Mesorhizobium amorphae CCBAU 01583]|nr:hypothetical protein AJ88_32265 [Mesorhizobium amorphae CCBAU 01583]
MTPAPTRHFSVRPSSAAASALSGPISVPTGLAFSGRLPCSKRSPRPTVSKKSRRQPVSSCAR